MKKKCIAIFFKVDNAQSSALSTLNLYNNLINRINLLSIYCQNMRTNISFYTKVMKQQNIVGLLLIFFIHALNLKMNTVLE